MKRILFLLIMSFAVSATAIAEGGNTQMLEIPTGVAGSLDADIDIGDIVISTDALQHDMDATVLGFARGEIPYSNQSVFPADEEMRKSAVQAVKEAAPDIHVFEGRVCSGDQFIASREQKEFLISEFGGLCCEMEGAAIAQVCYLNGTPFYHHPRYL